MALALALVLGAISGCDSSGGGSPFHNLGKRGDSALPNNVAAPARR
jgi:hypothetical protein